MSLLLKTCFGEIPNGCSCKIPIDRFSDRNYWRSINNVIGWDLKQYRLCLRSFQTKQKCRKTPGVDCDMCFCSARGNGWQAAPPTDLHEQGLRPRTVEQNSDTTGAPQLYCCPVGAGLRAHHKTFRSGNSKRHAQPSSIEDDTHVLHAVCHHFCPGYLQHRFMIFLRYFRPTCFLPK